MMMWELMRNLRQSTGRTLKKIPRPAIDLYFEMNWFSLQTPLGQFPVLSSLYHLPYISYHWDSFMRPISSLENSQMIENWSLLLWYYFWLWPNLRAGRAEIALIFSQFQRVAAAALCITTAQSQGWLTARGGAWFLKIKFILNIIKQTPWPAKRRCPVGPVAELLDIPQNWCVNVNPKLQLFD